MPNHGAIEKARVRDLTIRYLPSNLAQKEARRDCPRFTLHHHQASYGQKKFSNIGVIYEFVSRATVIALYASAYMRARSVARPIRASFMVHLYPSR